MTLFYEVLSICQALIIFLYKNLPQGQKFTDFIQDQHPLFIVKFSIEIDES